MHMATAVKLLIAALLLGSVLLAWFGPPPRRHVDLWLRGTLLAIGLAGYAGAAAAFATGAALPGALALAAAGELVCAAGWLGRGEAPPTDEDDDGGGGGGGGRGPNPPPIDWDAFERAFWHYARERKPPRQPV
jgi:hypothetical protein